MQITKFSRIDTVKRVYQRNKDELRTTLEAAGVKYLTTGFPDKNLETKFKLSCRENYILPEKENFQIQPGDWEFLEGLLEKASLGKLFRNKRQKVENHKEKKIVEEIEIELNEENVGKLTRLLKKNWPITLLIPENFDIKKEGTKCCVKCPECDVYFGIQSTTSGIFNTGNFRKHLNIHNKSKSHDIVRKNFQESFQASVHQSTPIKTSPQSIIQQTLALSPTRNSFQESFQINLASQSTPIKSFSTRSLTQQNPSLLTARNIYKPTPVQPIKTTMNQQTAKAPVTLSSVQKENIICTVNGKKIMIPRNVMQAYSSEAKNLSSQVK